MYKDYQYYNEYFSHLDNFKLVKMFTLSKDNDKSNTFTGTIEAVNTIHPLTIEVEIPATFPHNKLRFLTSSLFGYPHLIPTKSEDGNNKSWFCLNSPFAETVEEQLNVELERLHRWIKRYMRVDLPAIIEDPKLRHSLLKMYAYEWENIDEMDENRKEAMLVFVGDFANLSESFKEKTGCLNCVRNGSNKYYAFENKLGTNIELPYIIVDEEPIEIRNFMSMAKQYGWNRDIYKHLLPEMEMYSSSLYNVSKIKEHISKQDALERMEEALAQLNYPESISDLITDKIAECKELINKEDGIKPSKPMVIRKPEFYSPLEPDPVFDAYLDNMYEEEVREKELHFFALGYEYNNNLIWHICATNLMSLERESVPFNLGYKQIVVYYPSSLPLIVEPVTIVPKDSYFGRGALTESLRSKSIAIIGAGAVGSMVAESFARSGAERFGIWDNDIVEPGNICRSAYSKQDVGENKARALANYLKFVSPYCEVKTTGYWYPVEINGRQTYHNGEFYSNINYNSQEKALKQLDDYDVIIDCTGSNELLHFLSYAIKDKLLLSMCITNHSYDLLCFSNQDGNPYELRTLYLSKIEQDTKNFFVEGSGCYSPTFLALNCDIASLVNLAVRDINLSMQDGTRPRSAIWSHNKCGVVADRLRNYRLENGDIRLSISSETYMDAQEMEYAEEKNYLGFLLGGYSLDRKHIMVSHVISTRDAVTHLENAYRISNGIIDYIGDFTFSDPETGTYNDKTLEILAGKAEDHGINTNNPLLAVKNMDGSVSFFLYINGNMTPFCENLA